MPTVTVNDISIYYEIHGDGEPLVLIPELAIDVTAFERMIRKLSKQCKVIAFDNRGAGRTDKPDSPYSIEMMANDTAGLLAAIGINRAYVLGFSMGGRIATELTLRHPERVKGLILVSTVVKPIRPTWSSRLLFGILLRIPGLRTIGKKFPQPSYAFRRQLQAVRDYDATDRLGGIGTPTLILHGKRDRRAPYQLAEEMHSAIRGSRLIAFNGGHRFFFFRQRKFVDAVVDFLKSQKG